MENLPQSPVGPPATNASPPVQQPWAQSVTMGGRGPISHPWAASPYASTIPLLHLPGRIRGKASNYREGWICMVPEGLLISGKAMPTAGAGNTLIQVGIYFLFGALLGNLLAEGALRRSQEDALPWNCVEEIVLNSRKGRMCIVYHLPDAPSKPVSLGLRLTPLPLFQQFTQIATHYLGANKVHEGKIGPPTPPAQTAIALVIIFAVIFGIALLSASNGR